jgi:ABC-type proline/glycine betaine transport system permease subunit
MKFKELFKPTIWNVLITIILGYYAFHGALGSKISNPVLDFLIVPYYLIDSIKIVGLGEASIYIYHSYTTIGNYTITAVVYNSQFTEIETMEVEIQ